MENTAEVPAIPIRSHQSYHQHNKSQHNNQHNVERPPRRSSQRPPNLHIDTRRKSLGAGTGRRGTIGPASPEVISNLITSLSVISQPANNLFENQPISSSLSVPTSPGVAAAGSVNGGGGGGGGAGPSSASVAPSTTGSFGVEYGAYSQPSLDDLRNQQAPPSLDEIAASPPVIRTSKPPSGYSPLTAPKSPRRSRSPSRESGGGFRSFIRSSSNTSRPSSKGSSTSKHDDRESIGNLSIERGSAPTPELRSPRSNDSWGKKNRRDRGLMYMSSKERLREKDYEWRRTSLGNSANASAANDGAPSSHGGAHGVATPAAGSSSNHSAGRGDYFLAETAISEEPTANGEAQQIPDRGVESPRAIPTRESSLRKTGSKRTSARKSKRRSDGPVGNAIPEADEPGPRKWNPTKKDQPRPDSDVRASGKSFLLGADELFLANHITASASQQVQDSSRVEEYRVAGQADDYADDGAPFPAVSQGRHRDEEYKDRRSKRLSGRQSPGPNEGMDMKRSSSRLKRLSAGRSSGIDDPERQRSMENARNTGSAAAYERPDSADSVDDAVESYLCAPRLSQKIEHPQTGRVISFSEVGDPNGSAVFCCVGMGLTRYITAFYDELAFTLKLRLITPDRPGVGDSESYADGTATPLSWPDDIYAICQALKITKFSILAHSAGAIYALATALRMPQHIRGRIHLLAPWIPPSQMNVFGGTQAEPPTNAIPTSQRILRALPTPILKAANSSFMTATSSSITSSLPKTPRRKRKSTPHMRDAAASQQKQPPVPTLDKENFEQGRGVTKGGKGTKDGERTRSMGAAAGNLDSPDFPQQHKSLEGDDATILTAAADAMADKERQVNYDTRLTHAIWDLATTNANPAVDLLVCLERHHTIGFRYMDITRPVVIHHGSRDTRVPVDNVKWLGKTMRRCEVRVLEGEGHGLMASAGVMGAVLMEISKEWEDWIRVTSNEGRKERERGRRGNLGR